MNYYSEHELALLGLKSYGKNVSISRTCSIYSPSKIRIGNNVRIDDFCLLSGGNEIIIHDCIHISTGVYIYGGGGVHIESYSNVSAGCKVYSVCDDFSGDYMIGPMVPLESRNVIQSPVYIHKYSVVGCNSCIMPGTVLNEGVALGANTFVPINTQCIEWSIYAGTPVRYLKPRSKGLLRWTN